jgi:hypothetical protein
LGALIDAKVEDACFGPRIDAEAADRLQGVRIGDETVLCIGGRTAPDFGGGPLTVTGTLRWKG